MPQISEALGMRVSLEVTDKLWMALEDCRSAHPPTLVLTNLRVGKEDGVKLVKQIQWDTSLNLKVAFYTNAPDDAFKAITDNELNPVPLVDKRDLNKTVSTIVGILKPGM